MQRSNRPTLKDLIQKTGFSHGAISRAFNGQKGISEATREKILRVAREMGYHPNPSARNFKRGYSGRVGIILPNLRNTNYAALYERMDEEITKGGSSSILALTHDDTDREADIILHWSAGETDALIINPVQAGANVELYRKVRSWGYPLLFIYGAPGTEFDRIFVDYRHCMRKALSYLKEVGHRKVAYVGMIPPGKRPAGKYGILLESLPGVGLDYDEEASLLHVNGDQAGPMALEHWRKLGRFPTAVVAFNDQTAGSIYYEARFNGVDVPRDFSLLGSDDIAEARLFGLTTFRTDRVQLATEAFRMVQARMQDPETPVQDFALRSEFVVRDTLGPVPSSL